MCEMDVRVSSYCHLEGVGLLLQIRRIVLKIYLWNVKMEVLLVERVKNINDQTYLVKEAPEMKIFVSVNRSIEIIVNIGVR